MKENERGKKDAKVIFELFMIIVFLLATLPRVCESSRLIKSAQIFRKNIINKITIKL